MLLDILKVLTLYKSSLGNCQTVFCSDEDMIGISGPVVSAVENTAVDCFQL